MKLNSLNIKLYKKPKRVGRGIGSGKGKTAGRGVKGQKARRGVSKIRNYEGGQMPLYRRLPKRGFNSIVQRIDKSKMIINLSDLQSVIDKKKISISEKITLEYLKKAKNIKKNFKFLKVLGEGEIKSKIQLEAYQISESAKSKIEKAGGSVSLLEVKKQITK